MRHVYSFVLVLLLIAPAASGQTAGTCTTTGTATADLDVNNVRARLYNTGGLFWKGAGNVYNVPKSPFGTEIQLTSRITAIAPNAIFASGIWMGGKIDGEIRQAATGYGPWEFYPGPLTESGAPDDADCSNPRYDRIYLVSRRDLADYEQGRTLQDLRDWPTGLGAPTLTPAASDGIDNDGDGTTDEDGEMARVDVMDQPLADRKDRVIDLAAGERPDLIGDQMAWWIMNDVAGPHGRTGSAPMGLELHATAYAYLAAGALDHTTFYRYRMFKRGPSDLTDAYFGYWSDPDLGNASDDFIGADTTLDMVYVYNGDNDDEGSDGYGVAPPALGVSFLQGPLVDAPGQTWTDPDGTTHAGRTRRGMDVSLNNNSSADPSGDPRSNSTDWYNYLSGIWKDGKPIVNCGYGYGPANQQTFPCFADQQTTTFMWTGDPVTRSFWSEFNIDGAGRSNSPSDRQHQMSTGPFTLETGKEQTVQFAIVWSRGADHLDSITELRKDVAEVTEQFDSNFANRPQFVLPQGTPTLVKPVAGAVVPQGRLNLTASVPDLSDRVDIQVAREAFDDTTRSYANGAFVSLEPGTYLVRTRYVAGFDTGPWSDPVAFTVSDVALTPYDRGGLISFEVSANAAGPLDPPEPGAAHFQGFPTPGDLDPTERQQVGPARWLIYAGGRTGSYDSFLSRSIYSRIDNEQRIWGHTFEIRFTEEGSVGYRRFQDGAAMPVPFELWRTPTDTPDDPSDDVKLIPGILDYSNNTTTTDGVFNLSTADSPVSSAENDPYTDWIFVYEPVNTTPGTAGYDAYAGDGTAVDAMQVGPEVFARLVFVSWNGGTSPPYDQALPEQGTVFRIVDRGEGVIDAPVLLSPSDSEAFDRAPRLFWAAPEGLRGDVEIASDAGFRSPVAFTPVYGGGGSATSVTIDAIDAGSYFWRVVLRNVKGDSIRSDVRSFSVSRTITAEEADITPQSLTLLSPHPHPVSGPSRLRFYLPQSSDVRMEAYDLMGRRIAVLAEGAQAQGWSEAAWPDGLSAGVYLVRLRAGSETQTRQVVVVR